MSRYVDSLPVPAHPPDIKVIVVSTGRNGTLGLYMALNKLGFRTYHMKEAIVDNGVPHIRMMEEATRARHAGDGKRYDRKDLDKLLAGYDAVTDIPTQLLDDLVVAYPDAKYILTMRDTDSWERSMRKTLLPMAQGFGQFPLTVLQYCDAFLWHLLKMQRTFNGVLYGSADVNDTDAAMANARKFYNDHNARAQKIIPENQLLVRRLEDGLGWQEICPFLGVETPDEPYPKLNGIEYFKDMTGGVMRGAMNRAMLNVAAVVTPVLGVGVWYGLKFLRRA